MLSIVAVSYHIISRRIGKNLWETITVAAAPLDPHGYPIVAPGSDEIVGFDTLNGKLSCTGRGDEAAGIGKTNLTFH